IDIIFELQRRHALGDGWSPCQADIARWTQGRIEAETALYDSIAAELARGYCEGRYSFTFCDDVVNALYHSMISRQAAEQPPAPWPKLFWRVFEAFDAGELASPSVPDPIRTYTDPEIAEIVRDL
ncbi:MAG: hypothetical protein JWL74_222, partial [Alphaproteobacteria bacterium]|nr:hypothetical protein [Alphaproteobacteria bacterium]